MSIQIDILQEFFAAINPNDTDSAAEHFDPQVVRVEPEGFPTSGTYRGIDKVRRQLANGRGTWAEGTCQPEGFFQNRDKVVVYLHAWVRLKGSGEWTGGRFADGFVFREGKITEHRSFGERAKALEWAGIAEQP